MAALIEHVEGFLGPIVSGYSMPGAPSYQVVKFEVPWATIVMTLGLSHHELRSEESVKSIRHELLMMVPEDLAGTAAGVLADLADEVLAAHAPLLQGQVIGPRGPMFAGTEMEAIYVAAPVYLPEGFGSVDTDQGTVVFAWMVPITPAEAGFARSHGWSAFEDLLLAEQPALLDVHRQPVGVH